MCRPKFLSPVVLHHLENILFFFFSFYQELLSANVLVPFNGVIEGEKKQEGVKNYVAPSGMNTIAKHFLHTSGVLLSLKLVIIIFDTKYTVNNIIEK